VGKGFKVKFSAIFTIIVGLGMLGQWTASYLSKQIPELTSEPIRIGFHLAAEMLTAVALIIAGAGLLGGAAWGTDLFLIATGMLIYTAVVSPGYFAQKGEWRWLLPFLVILILAGVSIFLVL
jgi:hypothetical protein